MKLVFTPVAANCPITQAWLAELYWAYWASDSGVQLVPSPEPNMNINSPTPVTSQLTHSDPITFNLLVEINGNISHALL